jgi:hypothetical protein
MKKLILFTSFISFSSLLIARTPVSTLPEPTIVAKSLNDLWRKELYKADKLRKKGNLIAAAEAYKNLSENRQHRNEKISSLAAQRLCQILASESYWEQKELEDKRLSQESKQLMEKFNSAEIFKQQGNFAQAAALYEELQNAPYPHYWAQSWASRLLEEMRKSNKLKSRL